MIVKIYSVRDKVAETFDQPIFGLNDGMMLRWFEDMVNGKNDQWSKHAEDYSLWCIGEFNNITGEIFPSKDPRAIGQAFEYRKAA